MLASMRFPGLSKSRLLSSLQCPKRLWLEVSATRYAVRMLRYAREETGPGRRDRPRMAEGVDYDPFQYSGPDRHDSRCDLRRDGQVWNSYLGRFIDSRTGRPAQSRVGRAEGVGDDFGEK